jgi:hypothetical protein
MPAHPIPAHSLQPATWGVAALATVCALVLTWIVGFRIEVSTLLAASAVFLVLVGFQLFYSVLRPVPMFAAVTGGVAATTWSLLMVGLLALAAVGLNMPLIDNALIRIDGALGLDAAQFASFVAQYPSCGHVLMGFYVSSVPLIFLTILFLAVTGRHERMWSFALTVSGSAVICALLACFTPAIGAFAALGLPQATLEALPPGAGTYHLAAFEAYRSGSLRTIDVTYLEGVITFPSFHIVMALSTAWACRGIRVIGGVGFIWNAVVVVSIVPMGGHYFIDLFAGALIWAAFAAIASERRGPSRASVALATKPARAARAA